MFFTHSSQFFRSLATQPARELVGRRLCSLALLFALPLRQASRLGGERQNHGTKGWSLPRSTSSLNLRYKKEKRGEYKGKESSRWRQGREKKGCERSDGCGAHECDTQHNSCSLASRSPRQGWLDGAYRELASTFYHMSHTFYVTTAKSALGL